MTHPLVSVILPVYNAAARLKQTLGNVRAQTWPHVEIIIVDDGSTDESAAVARAFGGTGAKILHQENKGAAAARNRGLAAARGIYIQFWDADDLLSNDKIERQVLALEAAPGKLAVCSTVHFPDGDDQQQYTPSPYEDDFLQDADPVNFLISLYGGFSGHGSMVQPNAWLIPSAIIAGAGRWNEELTVDDDGEFFCRVILNSAGVVYTPGPLNYYRKYPGSESLSGGQSMRDLQSRLRAAISKKHQLLARTVSDEAKLAIYRQLYDVLLSSYPQYPDLWRQAQNELPPGRFLYRPVIGGRAVMKLAAVFGYRFARRLQYLIQSNKT